MVCLCPIAPMLTMSGNSTLLMLIFRSTSWLPSMEVIFHQTPCAECCVFWMWIILQKQVLVNYTDFSKATLLIYDEVKKPNNPKNSTVLVKKNTAKNPSRSVKNGHSLYPSLWRTKGFICFVSKQGQKCCHLLPVLHVLNPCLYVRTVQSPLETPMTSIWVFWSNQTWRQTKRIC